MRNNRPSPDAPQVIREYRTTRVSFVVRESAINTIDDVHAAISNVNCINLDVTFRRRERILIPDSQAVALAAHLSSFEDNL